MMNAGVSRSPRAPRGMTGVSQSSRAPRSRRRNLVIAAICAAVAVAAVIAEATPTVPAVVVRVFSLKYHAPDAALPVVSPLLTDGGSVIVQPKGNTLTVRDTVAAVERASKALTTWDVPPRAMQLGITLLKATSGQRPEVANGKPSGGKQDVPEEIRGISDRLRKLLNVTDCGRIDSVVVQGVEGQTVAYVIGGEYRLEFLLEPSGDPRQIRLKGLAFERLHRGPGVVEARKDILRTTINVGVGQPYILVVGRDEAAAGALVLVFNGSWKTAPGPGVAGAN